MKKYCEPCENNDVLVRKNDVLRVFYKYGRFTLCSERENYHAMQTEMANLPSVQPQAKTGRWIDGERLRWKCSKCGYEVWEWNNTPYCPNCGAKMKEVEECQ